MLNQNLGQYDMVLALSQSKINEEIEQLYDDEKIDKEWKVLTDLSGKYKRNQRDKDFELEKKRWQDTGTANNLAALKERADQIADLMEEKTADQDALIRERREIKLKIKELEQKKDTDLPPYQLLIEATINAPEIEIIKENSRDLLFKFSIDEGLLTYKDAGGYHSHNVGGLVYSFMVPIAKRQLSLADVTPDDDVYQQVKENYTVESIFLNFAKADVANFIATESKMSKDERLNVWLQLIMTNYFKTLGTDNDNPYILGYTVHKPQLSKAKRAMLEPCGISYSTSYHTDSSFSSFNFLMLTEKRDFPAAPYGGHIGKSLIELYQKDESLNGVIAINYNLFKQTYLARINENLLNAFCNVVKDLKISKDTDFKGDVFNLNYSNNLQMTIKLKDISPNQERCSLAIRYEITVNALLHDELPAPIGTVGVNQKFSTSGRYPVKGKTGKPGELIVELMPSTEGKITAKVAENTYQAPVMGRDTEEPDYKGKLDKIWHSFNNLFNKVSDLEKMYNTNFASRITSLMEKMSFNELDKFSNTVVMPGSNVYTFKNIRLMTKEKDDKDAVLFDISYAEELN